MDLDLTSKRTLAGETFGRLTVLRFLWKNKGHGFWFCRCSCPERFLVIVSGDHLRSGHSKSCGCLHIELSAQQLLKHGNAGGKDKVPSPEYRSYKSARNRCNNPNNAGYSYYGGRGIKFLFDSFKEFYQEVGPRPSLKHSLDRVDNDLGYQKGNIRWATAAEQCRNQRPRKKLPATKQPTRVAPLANAHSLQLIS